MLNIDDMPGPVRPYLGKTYSIGIELNVHSVFRNFPKDYGADVLSSFITVGSFYQTVHAIRNVNFPIVPCMLVVFDEPFATRRCFLYCSDTPKNRRSLATLKLTYG